MSSMGGGAMTRLNNEGQSLSLVDASTGNFPKKVFLDDNRTSLFDLRKEGNFLLKAILPVML